MEANNPDLDQPNDDFKWFGEGFDGFPKRLPDDCMEYTIFIIDSKLRGSHQEFERRERLKKIQAKGNSLLKSPLLKDYIWQRERFNLDLIDPKLTKSDTASKDKDATPNQYFLHGRTSFGDSIADEWLIVWLLLELSRTFPTAWIQVRDSDGEFLLVEAANALPKWLEPDLADSRVWINRASLKIIPLAREAGIGSGPRTPGLPGNITTSQALDFVSNTEKSVLHSPLIEAEAFYRLNGFPSAIPSSQHRALLSIPRNLSYILHKNPSYISPAIEAFYLRDPIAVKPLATKDTATLLFPPEDFVTVPTRFPKVAYAQLHSQEFGVPPAWTAVKPRLSQKHVEMGMKLSCGFEMLLRDPQNRDKRVVREINMLLEDIEDDVTILPSTSEISTWDQEVDDDSWLNIDFKDFEKELSGKGGKTGETDETAEAYGEGDPATQQNLKNMVSRFEKFMNDEDAGPDGARFSSASDSGSNSGSETDSDDEGGDGREEEEDDDEEGEDKAASFTDAEFETAMREMMGMPDDIKESTGLYTEARKLALEMEDEEEMEWDEEAEAEQVWKLMLEKQAERKTAASQTQKSGGGVGDKGKGDHKGKGKGKGKEKNVSFSTDTKGKTKVYPDSESEQTTDSEEEEEEFLRTDELSSDDDDDEEDILGGMNHELLKNLLESFKGQGGMAGPAGNLMGLMGTKMPRDESGV